MKSNNFKIGVLGGIGPEASAYFYRKFIEDFQSAFKPQKNTEFPEIIIDSIPATELVCSGNIKHKNLCRYKKGIINLNKHKPDFIVMICNTIHLFYNELQQISKSKILDISSSVLKRIGNLPQKNIYVLGTQSTTKEKLYHVKNKNYIKIDDKDILFIGELIRKYNLGIDKASQIDLFNKFMEKISNNNMVILGCTELALMNKTPGKNIVNTLDMMVEETLGLYRKNCYRKKIF